MLILPLRPLFLGLVLVSAFTAAAQVNDKGTFHLGLGWNGGVHATHFENSFRIGGVRVEDSDDDGAATPRSRSTSAMV